MALLAASLLSASFYAYIYIYDSDEGACTERPRSTPIKVYVWSTELMFNLVAPLATLILNVLVIRGLVTSRRSRARELNGAPGGTTTRKNQNTSKTSTTLMLLSVSFFYVATTLPMTFVYIIHPGFQPGDDLMTDEQAWRYFHVWALA